MQKITPFLWYDGKAEEAANLYVSIFKNSKIVSTMRSGADGPAMGVTFLLDGQEFVAFNGGPAFTFSQAMSLFVHCETQEEVDDLWERLSQGGEKLQCGWLKDKYGVSWQIIPNAMGKMMSDKDPAKAKRVRDAMLKMHKIDIKVLKEAYDQP